MEVENEKELGPTRVSRRQFFKQAGVMVGGAAAGAALSSCGGAAAPQETKPTAVPAAMGGPATTGEGTAPTAGVVEPAFEPEQTFYASECTVKAIDVKNGKIIRGRPLHYDAKYPGLKPWTITARGKTWTSPMKSAPAAMTIAFKKSEYHPSRVLYPLKRVDWEPGGDPAKINSQNRGKSKYVRISWDEAATIIASEINRIAEKYGPEAVLASGRMAAAGLGKNVHPGHENDTALLHYYFWTKYGRTASEMTWSTDTNIGFATGARFFWGLEMTGKEGGTGIIKDVSDNTEMLVGWGANAHGSSFSQPLGLAQANIFRWWKDELGIKFVDVNPDFNRGTSVYADKWIPVLPSTDPALQLAVAYTWLKEGTYQKEYIDTHSVGFDKWKAYVMGDEDGVPKTPAWAAPITGVPEYTIKALARQMASKVTSIYHGFQGGGVSRSPYSHESARLEAQLLALMGWGRPGVHQVNGSLATPPPAKAPALGKGDPRRVAADALAKETGRKMATDDADRQLINKNLLSHMFTRPLPITWYGGNETTTTTKDMFIKRQYPLPGKPEVKMLWFSSASILASRVDGKHVMEAFQKPNVEFILGQCFTVADVATFYDIILPISVKHDLYDIRSITDYFTTLVLEKKAIESMGEAKGDPAAVQEIAKKLGFNEKFTQGKTLEGLVKEAFDASGWTDKVSWEQLNENGYFSEPPKPDWDKDKPPSFAFFTDPVKNPLQTPSGKLEFYSQQIADHWPDDKERTPIARYIRGGPASEGWTHDESLASERVKQYPLLACIPCRNLAYHGTSMHADTTWIREIDKMTAWDGYMYQQMWINPVDAEKRGIKNGDIVKIFNERGGTLAAAVVCERVMPGVLSMLKAAGADFIIPNELNRGGSVNQLSPGTGANNGIGISKNAIGQNPMGYLVEVEKVTGAQMAEWRDKYPDAFARDYDLAYGPLTKGWIVEGGNL